MIKKKRKKKIVVKKKTLRSKKGKIRKTNDPFKDIKKDFNNMIKSISDFFNAAPPSPTIGNYRILKKKKKSIKLRKNKSFKRKRIENRSKKKSKKR
tara:strand:+ start:122 stop:409 length:288 start_codon:yes stop_codon:yes gene_type:complete